MLHEVAQWQRLIEAMKEIQAAKRWGGLSANAGENQN
jgi:hypothetical protein